jgi:hypothetical protein
MRPAFRVGTFVVSALTLGGLGVITPIAVGIGQAAPAAGAVRVAYFPRGKPPNKVPAGLEVCDQRECQIICHAQTCSQHSGKSYYIYSWTDHGDGPQTSGDDQPSR